MNTITKQGFEQSYADVVNLLRHTVHQFVRGRGGDFADLMSVANEAFTDAYWTYEGGRAKFSTHVRNRVGYALKIYADKEQRRTRPDTRGVVQLEVYDGSRGFRIEDFLEQLTVGSATVVSLVLDQPAGTNRQTILGKLRAVLYEAGWTVQQVANSFREIREALCD